MALDDVMVSRTTGRGDFEAKGMIGNGCESERNMIRVAVLLSRPLTACNDEPSERNLQAVAHSTGSSLGRGANTRKTLLTDSVSVVRRRASS